MEEPDAKRRRVLEETRQIDADSEDSGNDSSEEERLGYYAPQFLVEANRTE